MLFAAYAFDGSAVVTSRVYPLPEVEEDAMKHSGDDNKGDSNGASGNAGDSEGEEVVHLGAWGYAVTGKWGVGHVKGKAEVHELGSCWVSDVNAV